MSATTTVNAPAQPAPSARRAAGSDDVRIGARANLRHIGALARRNMLQIKADPESMFDAVLMPIIFMLLFVYVFGGAMFGERQPGRVRQLPGARA